MKTTNSHYIILCVFALCIFKCQKANTQIVFNTFDSPDFVYSSAYLGNSWNEIEWELQNQSNFTIQNLILTRIIAETNLNFENGTMERFCLGNICYSSGTEASQIFSMLPNQTLIIRSDFYPAFQEGHVEITYCVHNEELDPAFGVCRNVNYVYSLSGYLEGCTNTSALNYNTNATFDDGTCDYGETIDCDSLLSNEYQNGFLEGGLIGYNDGYQNGFLEGALTINTCSSDLNGDGAIGTDDLLLMLVAYGSDCDN